LSTFVSKILEEFAVVVYLSFLEQNGLHHFSTETSITGAEVSISWKQQSLLVIGERHKANM
jgi:hypothetical protein